MNTMAHEMQAPLRFSNLVRQFIGGCRSFREMRGQQFTDFLDRFDDSMVEFFFLKMRAHCLDNSLPEFFAAFLMNCCVAHHGKLVRAGGNENEHGISLAGFLHAKPVKFLLRRNQRIDI